MYLNMRLQSPSYQLSVDVQQFLIDIRESGAFSNLRALKLSFRDYARLLVSFLQYLHKYIYFQFSATIWKPWHRMPFARALTTSYELLGRKWLSMHGTNEDASSPIPWSGPLEILVSSNYRVNYQPFVGVCFILIEGCFWMRLVSS